MNKQIGINGVFPPDDPDGSKARKALEAMGLKETNNGFPPCRILNTGSTELTDKLVPMEPMPAGGLAVGSRTSAGVRVLKPKGENMENQEKDKNYVGLDMSD